MIEEAVSFDRNAFNYIRPDVKPALDGTILVTLANGRRIECKTVWQLLKDRVAVYTPENVEDITWIPGDRIIESARMYAMNKPASFISGIASDGIGKNSNQVVRARAVLRSITGNIDVKGGNIIPGPYSKKKVRIQG